eukprot:TRINITY_DN59903_c0_g1_i1.p1 TRINITY_DN59903_c0_g1~~TRINITY_DN59903_c0_g1_i1.p1  ORF type:complete len:141 (-),score=5.76 TRINITY_DN59903_c0_g1_i1:429-851(-)
MCSSTPTCTFLCCFFLSIWLETLLPWLQKIRPNGPWPIMMDNAPAHKPCVAKKVLESKGVWFLGQPPNSPDLQIVEEAWANTIVGMVDYPYHSEREFWESILCAWSVATRDTEFGVYVDHWIEICCEVYEMHGDNKSKHA